MPTQTILISSSLVSVHVFPAITNLSATPQLGAILRLVWNEGLGFGSEAR
jgi:hypothetical protein